jgi:hypothetical protein
VGWPIVRSPGPAAVAVGRGSSIFVGVFTSRAPHSGGMHASDEGRCRSLVRSSARDSREHGSPAPLHPRSIRIDLGRLGRGLRRLATHEPRRSTPNERDPSMTTTPGRRPGKPCRLEVTVKDFQQVVRRHRRGRPLEREALPCRDRRHLQRRQRSAALTSLPAQCRPSHRRTA